MSLGCDAGMEMMEDEFEYSRRTHGPFRKLSCSPNFLFEIHFQPFVISIGTSYRKHNFHKRSTMRWKK